MERIISDTSFIGSKSKMDHKWVNFILLVKLNKITPANPKPIDISLIHPNYY